MCNQVKKNIYIKHYSTFPERVKKNWYLFLLLNETNNCNRSCTNCDFRGTIDIISKELVAHDWVNSNKDV